MSLTKCVVKSTIRCHCCKRLYLMKQLLCFVTATPPQIGKMPLLYEKHSIALYYTLLNFTKILECIYEPLFLRPAMLLQQITKALLTDSAPFSEMLSALPTCWAGCTWSYLPTHFRQNRSGYCK